MSENKKRKVLFTNQQVTTDVDTKITKTVQRSGYITTEDDFVKFYAKQIELLFDLSGSQFVALQIMVQNMNYDNLFIYNSSFYKYFSQKKSIANAIRILIEKGLVLRLHRGLYYMNPYLCAKGSFKNVLKMRVDFLEKMKAINDNNKKK